VSCTSIATRCASYDALSAAHASRQERPRPTHTARSVNKGVAPVSVHTFRAAAALSGAARNTLEQDDLFHGGPDSTADRQQTEVPAATTAPLPCCFAKKMGVPALGICGRSRWSGGLTPVGQPQTLRMSPTVRRTSGRRTRSGGGTSARCTCPVAFRGDPRRRARRGKWPHRTPRSVDSVCHRPSRWPRPARIDARSAIG
jgi:hypothetical protein